MFALEKKAYGVWRRYVVCARRQPLEKVRKALKESGRWRVVYTAATVENYRSARKAA